MTYLVEISDALEKYCMKIDDLEQFISEFDDMTRQLKSIGAEIKDEDLICSSLHMMPIFFDKVKCIPEKPRYKDINN